MSTLIKLQKVILQRFELLLKHTLNNSLECLIKKREIDINPPHKQTDITLSTLKRLRLKRK